MIVWQHTVSALPEQHTEGCGKRGSKTPRAALAIPACGDGNPRVRRLQSPRAAFGIALYVVLCLLASGCSITNNLPEGEKLYRGIKSIDYDKGPTREKVAEQEGVITALADAYNTVEGLLTGDASVLQSDDMSDKAVRDSLRHASQKDQEAYEATKEEVEAVLSYAPNGALMGSSFVTHPFPIKLLIYNKYAGSKHRFGKWMFNHFAASPVLISNVNPRLRATVAKNTLRSRGYFRAQTSFETIPDPRDTLKERVRYNIHPGPVYHLDSIAYLNFPEQADSIISNIDVPSALHRGDPFSVVSLEAERTRIATALREQGYYYQRNEHITFRADTLQTPMLVKLQVQPSPTAPPEAMKPYNIGSTRVNIYKYGDRHIVDSMTMRGGYSFGYSRPVKFKEREPGSKKMPKALKGQAPLLKPRAIWRSMLFRKGDLYKQSLGELMQEGLASTNVFSSLRINYVPRERSIADSLSSDVKEGDTLDIVVNATLDKPYDAEFQGNLTGKTGGQIGPGASFSFSKRNAFRAAETLTLKLWGSYEWQTGANVVGKSSLLNSYEWGLSGSLSYPRFRFFGSVGRRLGRKFVSTTAIDLQARWQNRAGFFGRVSWSAGVNYTLQHKRNIKHEFSPLTITYDQLLHSTERFVRLHRQRQPRSVCLDARPVRTQYVVHLLVGRHAKASFCPYRLVQGGFCACVEHLRHRWQAIQRRGQAAP